MGRVPGNRQVLAKLAQLLDVFTNKVTQLVIRRLLVIAMTHTTPRKEIGAIAYIQAIVIIPEETFFKYWSSALIWQPHELRCALFFLIMTSVIAIATA